MKTGKIIALTATITVLVMIGIGVIFFAGYATSSKIAEKNKPLTDEEKIEKTVRAFFDAANKHDQKGLDNFYLNEEKPWIRPSGNERFAATSPFKESGEWNIKGMEINFSPDGKKAEVWLKGERINIYGRHFNLGSKPLFVKKYKGEWYIIEIEL